MSITDIDKVLTMVSVPGVTRGAVLVSGLRPALLPASQCPLPDLRVPFTPLIMSTLSNQKHAGCGATTEEASIQRIHTFTEEQRSDIDNRWRMEQI